MGAVMIPMMKKEGYHADYAVNVTTHAALVGALMPTSHNLIIYTLAAGGKVSIAALILAGIDAGADPHAVQPGAAYFVAVQARLPGRHVPGLGHRRPLVRGRAARPAGGGADPGGHPVGRVHGHRVGGRRGAVHAGLTVFVYRKLTLEQFLKAASKAVKTTGTILLLIGISSTFGYLISLYGVAELTGKMLGSGMTEQPWLIFLLVNVFLFVLGTFLDMAATILLCTPIFLPICQQFGMSSVQFGMCC
jgi:TRAP-type C4-dicarboxylate transport system permease large subunit